MTGLAITIATSVLAAVATSGYALVALRVVLGVGTAALFPAALAIVHSLLSANERRKLAGIALLALATEVAFAAGPGVGAILLDVGGWRLVVLAPAVPAAFAWILAARFIPRDPVVAHRIGFMVRALDLPGLAVLALTVFPLLVWLQEVSIERWYLLALTALLAVALVTWERRGPSHPLVPMAIMTRSLLALYVRTVMYYAALYALVFATPVWLVATRGLSAAAAAAVMGVMPLTTVVACALTPKLLEHKGPQATLLAGGVAMAVAAATLGFAGSHTPVGVIVFGIAVLGLPAGL